MDGTRSDGRLSAGIQCAVLLVMLGSLAVGLLGTRASTTDSRASALYSSAAMADGGRQPVTVAKSPPGMHLVILVDPGESLAGSAEFARSLDVGTGWVASLAVVQATEQTILGLREAAMLWGTRCGTDACPELIVLDLQTKP